MYNYEVKADDKGVEHFEAGPETITCDIKDLDAVASEEITNGIVNGNVISLCLKINIK